MTLQRKNSGNTVSLSWCMYVCIYSGSDNFQVLGRLVVLFCSLTIAIIFFFSYYMSIYVLTCEYICNGVRSSKKMEWMLSFLAFTTHFLCNSQSDYIKFRPDNFQGLLIASFPNPTTYVQNMCIYTLYLKPQHLWHLCDLE